MSLRRRHMQGQAQAGHQHLDPATSRVLPPGRCGCRGWRLASLEVSRELYSYTFAAFASRELCFVIGALEVASSLTASGTDHPQLYRRRRQCKLSLARTGENPEGSFNGEFCPGG